jgi:parvulin-like peptidyl-prolyl isomerase
LLRNVPAENVAKMREGMGQRFEDDALPSILKDNKLQTRAELEAKLRSAGSSIEDTKRNFIESQMARGWLHENVKARGIVTHQQLIEYYQKHPEEFRIQGRARWEQLTTRKSQFSSNGDAYMAVAALGNEVLGGQPFPDVAKARSQGVTASSGGTHNWTTQGSLVSKPLDEAIFALPVGSLSEIIEDDTGFHIVRVVEREDARLIPFTEAQSQIREKIKKQEEQQLIAGFKQRVRERTPIWTVFDNPDELERLSKLPSEVFRR